MDERIESIPESCSPAFVAPFDEFESVLPPPAPTTVAHDALVAAYRLVEAEVVVLESLDSDGRLTAVVNVPGKAPVKTKLMLTADGGFQSDAAAKSSVCRDVYSVAAVLRLMSILAAKKRSRAAKALLASAPEWLTEDYRCDRVGFDVAFKVADVELTRLTELQAYWALLDAAAGKTGPIPAESLVALVLRRYRQAPWHLQRSAMAAALSRIASAESEGLKVGSTPDDGALGVYGVRRPREGLRPYEVLLISGARLAASCSCPDFAKSTLGFCKHIAAVYKHGYGSERSKKRLLEATEHPAKSRLVWEPPLGLTGVTDPLSGLALVEADKTKGGAALAELRALVGNPAATPDRSDAAARLRYLERLAGAIAATRTLLVDPAVHGIVERELARVRWPSTFSDHSEAFARTIDGLRVKLYPYQRDGVLTALRKGRFLLGDDMGLGKTTQAVAWAESLLAAHKARRVLVICPAALKPQWRREWELVSGRLVAVVSGPADERAAAYAGDAPVLVMNYELLLRDVDLVQAAGFDAVILDEAQRIKNYATQTARQVKSLTPPFRLILTGTPMENRIGEFASLMEWIDSEALGPFWRLEAETAYHDGVGHGKRGVRGLRAIRERAAPHFLRRTRKEVLTQLPARSDAVVPVAVTEEQLEIHKDLATKAARLAAIAEHRPLTPAEHLLLMSLLTKMRIVSNGLAQYEFEDVWPRLAKEAPTDRAIAALCSPKLVVFRDLIEGLVAQEDVKIVVFSQWRRALRLAQWVIRDVLEAADAEAVFFTGAEDLKRRTENIVRFHDDPDVRLFLATDAGGVGLNLQRAATVCVNFELPWNPAVLEQRIGRIYRLGQERPVQIYDLVTQDTIETRITQLIANKRAVFDALFDGSSDEVRFEQGSGFLSQVNEVVGSFTLAASASDEDLDADVVASDDVRPRDKVEDDDSSGSDAAQAAHDVMVESAVGPEPKSVAARPPAPPSELEPAVVQRARMVAAEHVAQAMRGVRIERVSGGGVRLEADGAAATVLCEAFASMARMFGALS